MYAVFVSIHKDPPDPLMIYGMNMYGVIYAITMGILVCTLQTFMWLVLNCHYRHYPLYNSVLGLQEMFTKCSTSINSIYMWNEFKLLSFLTLNISNNQTSLKNSFKELYCYRHNNVQYVVYHKKIQFQHFGFFTNDYGRALRKRLYW